MAIVSGRLVFDRNRSATIDAGDTGLSNVPIVLQDTNTLNRLTVLTDTIGNYSFGTVPNGNYRIVEAYGIIGGVPTPGDFSTAAPGTIPVGEDPPINLATSPPPGATNLDSLSPNTIYITVVGADVTDKNFLDGPVRYTPISMIMDSCVTVAETNLITAADIGTFGTFLAGTSTNTGPAAEPYPGVTPGFAYVTPDPSKFTPNDGEYSVQNIMTDALSCQLDSWWRIADHTIGDETGRFMAVNGANPGAIFFTQTIPVTPNNHYLFSSWILNLKKHPGSADPALGVQILDQNGKILYDQTLGNAIPVNEEEPEWKEIGTMINSQNNTELTLAFVSQGPAAGGNDYCIDDIGFRNAQIPTFNPIKMIDRGVANVGETVTYTVSLTDTCTSTITNVKFQDTMPPGLIFQSQSVKINGISTTTANPEIGFDVPDISGGGTATITFIARVDSVPITNPTRNIATMGYSYTPIQGGIAERYSQLSNWVPLQVNELANLTIIKTAAPSPVAAGTTLTYTLSVSNSGPSPARNTVVSDTVPTSVQNPQYSIDGGGTWSAWSGSISLGTLAAGGLQNILIRGGVSASAVGTIVNTAIVSSSTPNLNPNNSSTATVPIALSADLTIVKTAIPMPVTAGDTLNYTIVVSNNGPSYAQSVVVNDVMPQTINNPQYSLDKGSTWTAWNGSLSLGTISASGIVTIQLRGKVDQVAAGFIINTATVVSQTPDPDLSNNQSTSSVQVNRLADVSITKTNVTNAAIAGDTIGYSLEIQNFGPSQALGIVVDDKIPGTIQTPQYSLDGGMNWLAWTGSVTLGTLAVANSINILVRGKLGTDATGTLINTATVSAATVDPNLSNNTSTVINQISELADLTIVKTSIKNPVQVRGKASYSLVVRNNGPSNAADVVLQDAMPVELEQPEYSLDGGMNWLAWMGSVPLGTLAVGSLTEILMRGIVSPGTTCIINTATITSTTPDPNPSNNASTTQTAVDIKGSGKPKYVQDILPDTAKYFKEEMRCEILSIPPVKPDVERVLDVMVWPEIVDIQLVETQKGKSFEGQYLSGAKLVVEINLKEKVIYVANDLAQSVHSAYYETLTSMFVILPETIDGKNACSLFRANRLLVTPYVEGVCARMLDERTVHKCILMILDVKAY